MPTGAWDFFIFQVPTNIVRGYCITPRPHCMYSAPARVTALPTHLICHMTSTRHARRKRKHLTRERVAARSRKKSCVPPFLQAQVRPIFTHHHPSNPPSHPKSYTFIMSSPANRRGRSAKKATASPASSAREPPSSPSQQQTTPRAARRLAAERAVPSSSPMFFQSSPTRSNRDAETPDVRMAEASSTVDDGDRTPRANNGGIRGMRKEKNKNTKSDHLATVDPQYRLN